MEMEGYILEIGMENTSVYKHSMDIKLLKDKRIWFMISGQKVSGSESRAVKVASYFAKKKIFKEVLFACNTELLSEYKKNKILSDLLNENDLKIIEKNKFETTLLSNESFNNKMIKKYLNYLFKGETVNSSIYRKFITYFSWKKFIENNIKKNDIIHAIYGDPVKIACWDLCQKYDNLFITEMTSPTMIKRDYKYLKSIFNNSSGAKRLHTIAVTETNYNIYIEKLGEQFYYINNINAAFYEGPFVSIHGDIKVSQKENIIIFPHRFFGRKNAVLFSEVIKRLYDNNLLEGWKVLFRGKGEDEQKIKNNLNKYIELGYVEVGYSNNIIDDFAKSKISVSIISTDNTPSNSIYESLRHGNLQLLSDTGSTRRILNHPDIFYCNLDIDSINNSLIKAIKLAESDNYDTKSSNMVEFYKYLEENNMYVNKAMKLYVS